MSESFRLYTTDELRNLYAEGDARIAPLAEIKAEILRRLWWRRAYFLVIGVIAIGSIAIRLL